MTTWTLVFLLFGQSSGALGVTAISGFKSVNACAIAGEKTTAGLADPWIRKTRYNCVEVKQ